MIDAEISLILVVIPLKADQVSALTLRFNGEHNVCLKGWQEIVRVLTDC